MYCTKCGSPHVHTQLGKKKTGSVWVKALMMGVGVSILLGFFIGIPASVIMLIVGLTTAPKDEPVRVCQSCGHTWRGVK